ncbi:MAG: hypothetical protein PVI78_11410 [Anaerolineales bacterium]|jgi:hypothetical protein
MDASIHLQSVRQVMGVSFRPRAAELGIIAPPAVSRIAFDRGETSGF